MSVSFSESFTNTFLTKVDLYRKRSIQWFARRPILILTLVIIFGTTLLPAVTIAALTPIAILINYIGIFGSSSSISTVYNVMFKGFLLAAFLTGILAISFLILTCVSVMHSYKLVTFSKKKYA